jgi:hypothetical protein
MTFHAAHPPFEHMSRNAMRRTGSPSYEEFDAGQRTVVSLIEHGSKTLSPRDGSRKFDDV